MDEESDEQDGGNGMKEVTPAEFQKTVSEYLLRNRSVLDVMTKLQDAVTRVNRAIAKSVTYCGCIKIEASKQAIPDDVDIDELAEYVKSHIEGEPCANCRDIIESEIGNALFYLAGVSCLLDLDMGKALKKENDRISTLGVYSLT
jgi:hypothetical protein